MFNNIEVSVTQMQTEPSAFSRIGNELIKVIESACVMSVPASPSPINEIPAHDDEIYLHLSRISSNLDPSEVSLNLNKRVADAKMKISIGSMTTKFNDDIDDDIWVQDAHTDTPKCAPAEHLSKIWIIPHDMVKKILKVTSQLHKHDGNSTLSRNISTNDRRLRYAQINCNLYTDTLFVTKKLKYSQGHTFQQFFVSDKDLYFWC